MPSPTFYPLQKHSDAVFTPIIDKSKSMLPESFLKSTAEISTWFGELNGLMNGKEENPLGNLLRALVSMLHPDTLTIFEKLKTVGIPELSILSGVLIIYCVYINTNFVICCTSLFSKIRARFRSRPPQYEETEMLNAPQNSPVLPPRPTVLRSHRERREISSMFYRVRVESAEFRDVNLRSVLANP